MGNSLCSSLLVVRQDVLLDHFCCLGEQSFFLFQDNVLNIINQIMEECIPQDRAPRDFCVKFPEEIRHDNLAGQLWFGAEVVGSCWNCGP